MSGNDDSLPQVYELHDQGSDAVLTRYSIFRDGEVFVLIDGERESVDQVILALNEQAAVRECSETFVKAANLMIKNATE